jgi:hypothetical protein
MHGDTSLMDPTPARNIAHYSQLTPVELAALDMLTRRAGESYELYVLRLAYAPGAAGRLARTVKLADLDEHIAHAWVPGAPPYEWARRHIAVGAARAGDNAGEAAALNHAGSCTAGLGASVGDALVAP